MVLLYLLWEIKIIFKDYIWKLCTILNIYWIMLCLTVNILQKSTVYNLQQSFLYWDSIWKFPDID